MLTWDDKILERIQNAVLAGMIAAARDIFCPALDRELREEISPPPSLPGEVPHQGPDEPVPEHQHLADSVMIWPLPKEKSVAVGTQELKAYYLEFGTQAMAPRPVWLNTALAMLGAMSLHLVEEAQSAMMGQPVRILEGQNVNPATQEITVVPGMIPQGANP